MMSVAVAVMPTTTSDGTSNNKLMRKRRDAQNAEDVDSFHEFTFCAFLRFLISLLFNVPSGVAVGIIATTTLIIHFHSLALLTDSYDVVLKINLMNTSMFMVISTTAYFVSENDHIFGFKIPDNVYTDNALIFATQLLWYVGYKFFQAKQWVWYNFVPAQIFLVVVLSLIFHLHLGILLLYNALVLFSFGLLGTFTYDIFLLRHVGNDMVRQRQQMSCALHFFTHLHHYCLFVGMLAACSFLKSFWLPSFMPRWGRNTVSAYLSVYTKYKSMIDMVLHTIAICYVVYRVVGSVLG